jgi:hypothetical protein
MLMENNRLKRLRIQMMTSKLVKLRQVLGVIIFCMMAENAIIGEVVQYR